VLFAIGFAAYVLSLVRLERWLADRGVSRRAVLLQPRTVVVLFVLFAMLAGGAALARALPALMDRAVRLG
jgi:hypothetical protein